VRSTWPRYSRAAGPTFWLNGERYGLDRQAPVALRRASGPYHQTLTAVTPSNSREQAEQDGEGALNRRMAFPLSWDLVASVFSGTEERFFSSRPEVLLALSDALQWQAVVDVVLLPTRRVLRLDAYQRPQRRT
jgi:hypothetical protein